MDKRPIVEMKSISKSFPGVQALATVDLTLYSGSVLGLVGENGAGKSTLMKVLTGTCQRDDGEVFYDGKLVNFKNEKEALNAGISIVPQELSYVPGLTVEENIFLGREPVKNRLINKKERTKTASKLLKSLNLSIDPKALMSDINIAQRQMIEIVKAISRNARVIVMDEPTSSLTTVETKQLFQHIKNLRAAGIGIIYISHKLDEIFELCDEITVMRDAHLIGSVPKVEANEDQIVAMMVGREVGEIYPEIGKAQEEEVLRVENLKSEGVFEDVSFTVRKGEVVGFSGMVGAGRSEVMRAIFGIDKYTSGDVYLNGEKLKIHSTSDAIAAGIGMVTEDRAIYGFVGGMSVKENVVLPSAVEFSKSGFLNKQKIKSEVEDIRERLLIKTPNIEQKVGFLSGGNQQKVVLAKWLIRDIKVLILDEPTRGIDVGAKQEIYKIIKELAEQGMAIIVISSEMPEVIGMSQRVVVMDGGRILTEFSRDEVTQDKIMQAIQEGGRKL